MFEWKDPTMTINSAVYAVAFDLHHKAKQNATTVENRARVKMPMRFAHAFFRYFGLCRTNKGRMARLIFVAGVCQALAFELSEKDAEAKP